jgi:hypothetical protein
MDGISILKTLQKLYNWYLIPALSTSPPYNLYNPIPLYPPSPYEGEGGRKRKRGVASLKLTFLYISFKGEGEEQERGAKPLLASTIWL